MSETVTIIDPSTLEQIDEVPVSTRAETEAVVRRAMDILRTSWSWNGQARSEAMRAWAGQIRAYADELAAALVAQTGKPIAEARRETASCAATLDYYAGLTHYVGGRAGTLDDGSEAHLVREPVGVTAFIVPYNWPASLLIRDLAPALAAGVTAVIKPAPQTTLVTRRLVELGHLAGVPTGAVAVLVGDREVGEDLINHPLVRAVAFTGSTEAGRQIGRLAATGVKRARLELGGKSASVIFADADLDKALAASSAASVITSGQMCMACTRVLVHSSRYEEAVDQLVASANTMMVGDPRKDATRLGPLISQAQFDKVSRYLDIANKDGKVVCGGESVHPDGLKGYFLTPAIVTGLDVSSAVVQDDIFGPVLTVEPFDTEDEAVALANATPYGLSTSVWTTSLDTSWRVGRGIQAGSVWINGYNKNALEIPSGGFKSSGLGRTRGVEGIEEFTELKHIHFSVGS